MFTQWKSVAFWVGAILIIVLATFFYQPAAAKTGSLLVWTRNRIYVMDIDSLALERVAPASAGELMEPSPGCFGQGSSPCWVVVGKTIYLVDLEPTGDHRPVVQLPVGSGFRWDNELPVSWSPDGNHLAFTVFNEQTQQSELQVFNVLSQEIKVTVKNVDPAIAVAWTSGCAESLTAVDCELAYKKIPEAGTDEFLPMAEALKPASGSKRQWPLPTDEIFELRWTPADDLLFSRPKRHFRNVEDHASAYRIPPGGKLANMSPDSQFTVYYQPFTLSDCQSEDPEACLHLGVWINSVENPNDNSLIYSMNVSDPSQTSGLNFIPTWSPDGDSFVFFQEGQLIHYDVEDDNATIWYKPILGKLRTVPVFSPNEEAVAFVDNQGQGFSEYRLVVVNPRLQPVEHIIETNTGFRILAWLPN